MVHFVGSPLPSVQSSRKQTGPTVTRQSVLAAAHRLGGSSPSVAISFQVEADGVPEHDEVEPAGGRGHGSIDEAAERRRQHHAGRVAAVRNTVVVYFMLRAAADGAQPGRRAGVPVRVAARAVVLDSDQRQQVERELVAVVIRLVARPSISRWPTSPVLSERPMPCRPRCE